MKETTLVMKQKILRWLIRKGAVALKRAVAVYYNSQSENETFQWTQFTIEVKNTKGSKVLRSESRES